MNQAPKDEAGGSFGIGIKLGVTTDLNFPIKERGVGVGPAQGQGTEVREPAAGCRALCLQLRRQHLGRAEAPFL